MNHFLDLGSGRLFEYNKLRNWLQNNNYVVKSVTEKEIKKGKYVVTAEDFADGTIPFIYTILRKAGKDIPIVDSYPEELRKFLYRKVVKTKLQNLHEGFTGFVKPFSKLKLFTGFVAKEPSDMHQLSGFTRHTEVYISDVVKFISEYRFYVIGRKIKAYGCYDGDENIIPDLNIVQDAIKKLVKPPSAFCIDFGVLDSGETALVEYNDGFFLGWYLDDKWDVYYELIKTRFQEMMK